MIYYQGVRYRGAANPARDEKYLNLARAAYDKLKERMKAGNAEVMYAKDWDPKLPPKGIIGWVVRDLEPRLNVALRPKYGPRHNESHPNGEYNRGGRNSPYLITLYNADWSNPDGFWHNSEKTQRELLPYAISKHTFLHEYIHHLDWARAPSIGYGEHKSFEDMTPEEYAAYLSEPAEFNAWFQSYSAAVEEDIDFWLQRAPTKMWPKRVHDADDFVRWFMQNFQADGWRIDVLPPKIQRKIQKRLAQMFLHLWRDPEPRKFDVKKYADEVRRYFVDVLEQRVEGWNYMDDPDGVEQRFNQFIGKTEDEFIARRELDTARPSSELLAIKTMLRKLYQELLGEKDHTVAAGRRKQEREL
jgi:hypothetical protein